MYIQTSKHHIEHINSMTYDKGSGLYINGSKFGVRPEEAQTIFNFILDAVANGAQLVCINELLERSRYDSENR